MDPNTFQSKPRSSKYSLSLRFPYQNSVRMYLLPMRATGPHSEAPQYVIIFNISFFSLGPNIVLRTLFPENCQTSLSLERKEERPNNFHNHAKQQAKFQFSVFQSLSFRQKTVSCIPEHKVKLPIFNLFLISSCM